MQTSDFRVGRILGEGSFARVVHGRLKSADTSITEDWQHQPKHHSTSQSILRRQHFDSDDGPNDPLSEPTLHLQSLESSLDSSVAIKVVEKVVLSKNPAACRAIKEEQRILRFLNQRQEGESTSDLLPCHPVVKLLASFHDAECLYLVMECALGTLQDVLQSRSERQATSPTHNQKSNHRCYKSSDLEWINVTTHWGYQILSALQFIHSHGIVHCDIKPSNLLLKRQRDDTRRAADANASPDTAATAVTATVQLCDFGSALDFNVLPSLDLCNGDVVSPFTAPIGTASYASPQLLQGQLGVPLSSRPHHTLVLDIAASMDLWSFGCILFAMHNAPHGQSPFAADSDALTVEKIMQYYRSGNRDLLDFTEGYPDNWKDLIRILLHPDPQRRVLSESDCETADDAYRKLKQHSIWRTARTNPPPRFDLRQLEPKYWWWCDDPNLMQDGKNGWSVFLI